MPIWRRCCKRIAPAYIIGDVERVKRLNPDGGTRRLSALGIRRRSRTAADSAPTAEEVGEGIAVQLFTSGTTAAPKAALLRHANLLSYILGTVEFGSASPDEAALVSVPPYHIAGIAALLSSIYSMRRILLLPAFDPDAWLALAGCGTRHQCLRRADDAGAHHRAHGCGREAPISRRCKRSPTAADACRRN